MLALVFSGLFVKAQSNFIAAKQKKWGFINQSAQWVIHPKYDFVGTFNEGVALVCQRDKYGLIDTAGNKITPLAFDELDICQEGMVGFRVGAKWGFLDARGDVVVKPTFDFVFRFNQGLCAVLNNNPEGMDQLAFIDKKGQFVIPFSKRFAYLPDYYLPRFKSDRAVVILPFSEKNLFSADDSVNICLYAKGKPVSKKISLLELHRYYRIKYFSFNQAGTNSKNRLLGYYYVLINKKGEILVSDQVAFVNNLSREQFCIGFETYFNQGVMPVVNPTNVVLIDTSLTPISTIDADMAFNFYEGVAGFVKGSQVGLMDLNGKELMPARLPAMPNSDFQLIFQEGKAAWWNHDQKFGYINPQGDWVIQPQFDYASPFYNGRAYAVKGKNYFLIDDNGKQIGNQTFKSILIDICPCLK